MDCVWLHSLQLIFIFEDYVGGGGGMNGFLQLTLLEIYSSLKIIIIYSRI